MSILSREPVRAYLGGLLLALVALAAGYGLVDGERAALWFALVTALVGVPAVEGTRARVTPYQPRHADTGE